MFQSLRAYPQGDTTRQLQEVVVEMWRVSAFKPGSKVVRLDSAYLAQFSGSSLSEVLAYEGSVGLKQYGPAALTSTSFRGASSFQTPVLWNGFNIQNPMYGQPDLSLFPAGASDKVSLQYGAGATQIGSGAVSGAILLENTPHFNEGFSVGLNSLSGSFGTYNNMLHAGYGTGRVSVTAKVYYNTAQNDFSFNNTALGNAPRVVQQHASLYNYGALSRLDVKLNSRQQLAVNAWYQYSDRSIPPLMTQPKSAAAQQDGGLKASAEWKRIFNSSVLKIRSGIFDDKLDYTDSLAALYSHSHSTMSVSEAEYTLERRRHLVQAGINATYSRAVSGGYPQGVSQWRSSLFLLYRLSVLKHRLQLQASVRKEMAGNRLISPAIVTGGKRSYYDAVPEGSIGLDLAIFRWLKFRGNASTLYRAPTLNDLYWSPGGNRELKPEEGLSEEAGLAASFKIRRSRLSYDVTYFNRNVNNWIIWLPDNAYWSPQNIMNVWSRGFEHVATLAYSKNKLYCRLSINYTYTLSTNRQAKTENDASLNKQLIYCPVHQGALKLYLSYASWYVSYLHSYTGYRYTSTDNLDYLPDYAIAKAGLGRTFEWKRLSGSAGLSCTNIFDIAYQSVLWQAMPGRSYEVVLKINFRKKLSPGS